MSSTELYIVNITNKTLKTVTFKRKKHIPHKKAIHSKLERFALIVQLFVCCMFALLTGHLRLEILKCN